MFRDFKKYEIYEDGRVWSYKSNKWMKPTQHHTGYLLISLYDNDGQHKLYQHHRVIFESVTGQPIPEGFEVNHIDENKANNHISNLNLMSRKENCNWGTRNERMRRTQSKSVEQYDKNGNLIQVWASAREVGRQLGFYYGNIAKCCRGKLKTYKGFIWKYAS